MTKIVWVGGVHGVGKSSSLRLAVDRDPSLDYLYLGRMFYETAEKMGYQWMELADKAKLLEVEEIVTKEMREKIKNRNILIDCHFAIQFGKDITYPGFHCNNLESLFFQNLSKKGVLSLVADPKIIIQRRKNNSKRFKAYPPEQNEDVVKRELLESQDYFKYFVDTLSPDVTSIEIDTSNISIEKVANNIWRFYDAI